MKRFIYIFTAVILAGCSGLSKENLFEENLNTLTIALIYPSGFEEFRKEGVSVHIEDMNTGASYSVVTDEEGKASIKMVNGLYRLSVHEKTQDQIFNGIADNIRLVDNDLDVEISLLHSVSAQILIKELYTGGCKKLPIEGNYQSDKYAILHNNSSVTVYLDGLCFGTLDPYNSSGTNVWVEKNPDTGQNQYPDFVPVIQCVWQFPGDGDDYPLEPGEDAVIVLNGAIDHTSLYPLSVNLNHEDYFVCYNNTYFPNTIYHPSPGDKIRQDHILNVVVKTGQANAYPISLSSPTFVLFYPQGMTIQEHIQKPGVMIQKPGSSIDYVVCIPEGWVLDAMEVFDSRQANNVKRLKPSLDAGYVSLKDTYLGNSYLRKVDQVKSEEVGYEVLIDTNNSSNDFFLSEKASLYSKSDE